MSNPLQEYREQAAYRRGTVMGLPPSHSTLLGPRRHAHGGIGGRHTYYKPLGYFTHS